MSMHSVVSVSRLVCALAFAGVASAVSATTANLTVSESTSSYGAIADDGTRWSGGVAPKNSGGSAIDYVVPAGTQLMVSGEKGKQAWKPYGTGNYYLFGGKSLTLDGGTLCLAGWNGDGSTNPAFTFTNDGLILKSGTVSTVWDANTYGIYAGKVTVDSNGKNVTFANNNGRASEYRFIGEFSGTAASTVMLDCSGNMTLRLENAKGFLGTYYFRQTNKSMFVDCLRAGMVCGGGTLTVTGTDEANTVGSMNFWNPMTIVVNNILSGVTVTSAYVNSSTLTLDFSAWDGNLGVVPMTREPSTRIIPLLMLGDDATGPVDQSKINLLYPSRVYGANGRTYELVRDEKGIYIRLTQTHPVWQHTSAYESANTTGFTNAGYWEAGTSPLPGAEAASDYDYYVGQSGLRLPNGESTCYAHLVSVGNGAYICRATYSGSCTFLNEGLLLGDGSSYQCWLANGTDTLWGKVTVRGSTARPITFTSSNNGNTTITLGAGVLYGDAASVIQANDTKPMTLALADAVNFAGTVIAGDNATLALGSSGPLPLAGVSIGANDTLRGYDATGVTVVKALSFAAGATLAPAVSGGGVSALKVTDALSIASPLKVTMPSLPEIGQASSCTTYPILTVAAGAGDIALENFVIDTSAAPAKLVKKASWSIEIGEDGSKSLVLTMQKPGLMLIFR